MKGPGLFKSLLAMFFAVSLSTAASPATEAVAASNTDIIARGTAVVVAHDGRHVVIRRRPPARRIEVRPNRPSRRRVWIAGHWTHRHGRFVWVRGRWAVPPRRAAVYVRPVWKPHAGGYILVGGVWR